jgi:dihydroorotate dehydrogenase electron transfer subunit
LPEHAPAPQAQAPARRPPAPFGRRLLAVSANEPLGAYRLLRVRDPHGPRPEPGQFAMLAAAEGWGGGQDERPYLARAFSFCRWRERQAGESQRAPGDGERPGRASENEAEFLLEDVGPGSHRLCALARGDLLWAMGPLGRGFSPPGRLAPGAERPRALLVGGGVGVAPLAILAESLAAGVRPGAVSVLLGFRDAAHAAGAALLHGARVATDDGSIGVAGSVLELLRAELEASGRCVVYACGPAAMLEAVRALCARRALPCELALEAPMACGFGACHGCVVPARGGGYLRVCVEGPVIDASLIERVEEHAGAPA